MKILISGAGGFLGTEIVSQLAEKENVQLVALTSQEKRLREKVGDSRNVTVFDRNSVFESDFDFSDTDLLINCAFPRNADGIAMADGLRYVERLLEAAVAGGVKSVINISSQSVYSQVREQPPMRIHSLIPKQNMRWENMPPSF
jgi:nucleoside-diphosphate-sugar epimerase